MPRDQRFLTRRAPQLLSCAIIGVALWARWPVLYTGFNADDFAQLSMMRGTYAVPRAPLSLFTFSDGSAEENERLRSLGFFPWWSHLELRVSLMRPLASALMWFDLRLFRYDAFAYHLHSACWWLAMMLALYALLRRLIASWAVPLAIGLFSVHPAHILLLGWIANRNAIVATTFALLGLLAQRRAQESGQRSLYVAAASCYAFALAASEYAVGYLVYAGMMVWLSAPSQRSRVRRSLACAGGLALYVITRAALGYGTRWSGMYIDPFREPLTFLVSASQHFPVLVGDAVLAVRSTWWSSGFPWGYMLVGAGFVPPPWAADLTPFRWVQTGIGVVACLLAASILRRALRRESEQNHGAFKALALGFPLSLAPALASLPESRLMLPAVFGWTAVLAHEFVTSVRDWETKHSGASAARCAGLAVLIAMEGVLPVAYAHSEARELPLAAQGVLHSILEVNLDPIAGQQRDALLVSAVDPTTTIYIPLIKRLHGQAGPSSCQLLMGGYGRMRLVRITDTSFELERLQPEFTALDVYASAFNREPFNPGQRYRAGALQALVVRTHEGRPMVVRYELDRSLDSHSIVLLTQTRQGLTQHAFPAIGGSIEFQPGELPDIHALRTHKGHSTREDSRAARERL